MKEREKKTMTMRQNRRGKQDYCEITWKEEGFRMRKNKIDGEI